jgi:hypothetical protein
VVILVPDEMMWQGLMLAGFNSSRQSGARRATNLEHFKSRHGSLPVVRAQMQEDLQMTNVPEAETNAAKVDADCFLMAIQFLAHHQAEKQREGVFMICDRTAQKWGWHFAEKIQASKKQKTAWPEEWAQNNDNNPVFLVSVDGFHCCIFEPKHPTLPKNHKCHSHKFHKPAVGCKIGLLIFHSCLVWMSGQCPAGTNGTAVFGKGLKNKIPAGKRVVGDSCHRREKEVTSTPNSLEPTELQQFKSRARACHEHLHAQREEQPTFVPPLVRAAFLLKRALGKALS